MGLVGFMSGLPANSLVRSFANGTWPVKPDNSTWVGVGKAWHQPNNPHFTVALWIREGGCV